MSDVHRIREMCPLLERTSTCRALASFNQFFMAPIFRSEPETILRLSSFKNFPVKALPPLLIRSKGERILQTEREEESKVKLRSNINRIETNVNKRLTNGGQRQAKLLYHQIRRRVKEIKNSKKSS